MPATGTVEKQSKLNTWQESNEVHNINELREELKLFKLNRTTIGMQEVFKSAPKNIMMPTELLGWVRQILSEGLKVGLGSNDLIVLIRTKAISNGYSSQQVSETMNRAVMQLNNELRDEMLTEKYQQISKN